MIMILSYIQLFAAALGCLCFICAQSYQEPSLLFGVKMGRHHQRKTTFINSSYKIQDQLAPSQSSIACLFMALGSFPI